MEKELTPAVNERLRRGGATGVCSRDEMNDKGQSKIRMLSETDAFFAVRVGGHRSVRSQFRYRNYFMGILNRYMQGCVELCTAKSKSTTAAAGWAVSENNTANQTTAAAATAAEQRQQQQRRILFSSHVEVVEARGGGMTGT
jgi:hypothetical protein